VKRKWTFKEYYLLFLAVTLLIYGAYSMISSKETEDYSEFIYQSELSIDQVEKVNNSPLVFKAYSSGQSSNRYYAVFSEAVGYQSTIEVMTIIDEIGHINVVDVIAESETPAFFEKIKASKFEKRFTDLSVKEPISINNAKGYFENVDGAYSKNSVDSIGGATISSVAIAKAVNDGTSFVAENYFDETVISPFNVFSFGLQEAGLLFIFVIAVLSLRIKAINKFRKWILLYSVTVTGFYLNQFINFGMIFSFMNGSWPGMNNFSWYLLIFGTLGLVFLTGRNLYCQWICPFGAVQEVILRFGGLKQIKLNPKLVSVFRLVPPTLAYIALMIVFRNHEIYALAYDPFGAIFNMTALPIMWISLPLLIFISLFQYRFYCTYFCPIGFSINLTTKLRNKGVERWKKQKKAA